MMGSIKGTLISFLMRGCKRNFIQINVSGAGLNACGSLGEGDYTEKFFDG